MHITAGVKKKNFKFVRDAKKMADISYLCENR